MSRRLLWRTTIPIIAVGVLLLSAGVYGAWRVHRLYKRGSDILSENVSSIRTAEELEAIAHKLRYRLKRFVSTENERHLEQVATLIPEGRQRLDRAEQFGKSTRERRFVERAARGFERFVGDFDRLMATAGAERSRIAESMADEAVPGILGHTQSYIQLNEEELVDSNERNQSTANRLMYGLLLLGTCGGVAGLLAGYGIARFVKGTIVQLSLPIRDTAGKLDEVVGPISISTAPGIEDLEAILKTVSERVSMVVERLRESEREMLRAEQLAAVGQLAAGLAHELRNPLTSVKTILQLADSPEKLTDRDLQVTKQEVGRLEESLQTFLNFARPSELEKRPLDLNELLKETVELVSRRAERQRARLDYLPAERPISLVADSTQVRQLVLNLLLNALEATPPGGRVLLDTAIDAANPRPGAGGECAPRAVIRVRDSGAGLPARLGDRIFDPFVSTKATGTGLGLSICKRIVEAHGGEIRADDRGSDGAIFSVWLPLPHEAPRDAPLAPREAPRRPTRGERHAPSVAGGR